MNGAADPTPPTTEPRRIRGIIFDFDGTILDTESPSFQSWQEVYNEHGCAFPFELWTSNLGGDGSHFDTHGHLETLAGRMLDRDGLRARRRLRTNELIAACEALPGVIGAITAAGRLGLKRGIASSSPRDWVEEHLTRLGLLDSFDAISCSGDVARVKPDPALYRRTLALLGLRPDQAIAIEDSPNGVLAAKAAGLTCIVVPNAVTCRLDVAHADLRVDSLAHAPIERLIEQLGVVATRDGGALGRDAVPADGADATN